MPLRRTTWIWITLCAFAADRGTKYAIEKLTPLGYHRTYIRRFFSIVHESNPGVAFGFFSDSPSKWITGALAAGMFIVCVLLIWIVVSDYAGGALSRSGISLILGGAFGNLYDRLFHSGVTDFLYFQINGYHWPAFNLADSAITIGAVLVAVELIRHPRSKARSAGN